MAHDFDTLSPAQKLYLRKVLGVSALIHPVALKARGPAESGMAAEQGIEVCCPYLFVQSADLGLNENLLRRISQALGWDWDQVEFLHLKSGMAGESLRWSRRRHVVGLGESALVGLGVGELGVGPNLTPWGSVLIVPSLDQMSQNEMYKRIAWSHLKALADS